MTRRTLEARARAIIADAKGCDVDTRRAVEISLDDLKETVRRAERGEMILDTTDARIQDPPPTLAEMIAAVLAHPDVPPSFRHDIRMGLSEVFNDLGSLNDNVTDSAKYIALLLEQHAAQKGGE
ncbi:MAG: hypothetical protein H0X14_00110 [Acidobacteria bacterium]|nr:hypothetical protein [Acidobacteriota bacterium]